MVKMRLKHPVMVMTWRLRSFGVNGSGGVSLTLNPLTEAGITLQREL